jgi:hypothetical protein
MEFGKKVGYLRPYQVFGEKIGLSPNHPPWEAVRKLWEMKTPLEEAPPFAS